MSHTALDETDLALLRAPNFCHVSTLRPDGTILAVVVWVDTDGEHVVLNSVKGRAWAKNLYRNGTATLTIQNLENPYEYVTIAGHLADATHDGAREHIDAMERKYRGNDVYPLPEGQKRVILRIAPDVVHRYRRTLAVRIDHVIWATKDLDDDAARMEREHGLQVLGGGRHIGHGTHNRVVPLGGGFLELLAVADAREAAGSPVGRAVAAAPEGLFGWAVAVADAQAEAERLGAGLDRIERSGMTASLAAVGEAMAEPWLPFFIERDAGIPDPRIGREAGGIAWVEVAGDAPRLRAWLGGAELPVRVTEAEPRGVRAVGLGSGRVIR